MLPHTVPPCLHSPSLWLLPRLPSSSSPPPLLLLFHRSLHRDQNVESSLVVRAKSWRKILHSDTLTDNDRDA